MLQNSYRREQRELVLVLPCLVLVLPICWILGLADPLEGFGVFQGASKSPSTQQSLVSKTYIMFFRFSHEFTSNLHWVVQGDNKPFFALSGAVEGVTTWN